MADKYLSDSTWKAFVKGRAIKDAALVKALAELVKAERVSPTSWLEALKDVEKALEALRKEHKADKEVLLQLTQMDKAIENERRAASKGLQKEADEADESEDEESPAALTTKLIPLLRAVKKNVPCQALVAVSSKEAAVMLSNRTLTPAARKPLTAYLGAGSAPKFVAGECIFEANAVTFVLKTEVAGLAKKLRAALLKQTEQRVKVRVRGENPEDIDDDGELADPADSAAASGATGASSATETENTANANQGAESAANAGADAGANAGANASGEGSDAPSAQDANVAAKKLQMTEFKSRFAALVPRIKELTARGWVGGRAATVGVSEAASLATSDPLAALARLNQIEDAVAAAPRTQPATTAAGQAASPTKPAPTPEEVERKRQAAAKVEADREAFETQGQQIKTAIDRLMATDPPNIPQLKVLMEGEFKRAASLAKLLKEAGEQELDIKPPPAKVSFKENAEPDANQWTDAICRAAFKKYGWFTFKAMRKSGKPVDLPGVTTQNRITDAVMWKLYQFRRHYVDLLIAALHVKHKAAGLLFKSGGSEDIESDLDITVASPNSGVDVVAMKEFNDQVKKDFGRPPGRVFDTNLYARDYRAIEDNLSAKADAGQMADHAIAEPVGPVANMAGIDQDVATLMKQRRFLDEASFNKMWHALRDSMPAGEDRDRIQRRFEEAEDVYLLTAREKVLEIVKTVEARLDQLPADQRLVFENAYDDFKRTNNAANNATGPALSKALADVQAALPKFLDLLEEHFQDYVMETTDAMYAKTMAALRADQARVNELESHLLESTEGANCETLHKGVPHAAWVGQAGASINALKARIKQAQFTNIVFANEAYVSQGAITHIVAGMQASTPQKKAEVLEEIKPAELLQSANEQMADFYKDMKTLEHEAKAAAAGTAQRRANGEAFVHASKYLSRMLNAAAMLQDKYKDKDDGKNAALARLRSQPFDLCVRAGANSPQELQDKVDAQLVRLRKSSTLPGDAKAEVAVAEVQQMFGVTDIGGLRELITAFGVDFNQRVRQLPDFSAAQEVSPDAEREYFRPAR